jgi:hypothetical protein
MQLAGGFLMSTALEEAQDNGRAVTLGEPVHFFVQDPAQLGGLGRGGIGRLGDQGNVILAAPRAGAERDPASDAVEPGGNRAGSIEASRLAEQDQEDGLESVLGVVGVAEQPVADVPDQGTVPADEKLEGGFVALDREAFQELAIRQGRLTAGPLTKIVQNGFNAAVVHEQLRRLLLF